jgi:hypothetical protein
MHINRHFTKVYTRPRKPFTQRLEQVEHLLEAVENVVVQDVRFALTGEETATNGATVQSKESTK